MSEIFASTARGRCVHRSAGHEHQHRRPAFGPRHTRRRLAENPAAAENAAARTLRDGVRSLRSAARAVALSGSDRQVAEARRLLDDTGRAIYRILAQESRAEHATETAD